MGVAGSGKSTVARELARRSGASFIEGDDLHSPENVARMTAGVPLSDADRWPWLTALRIAMRAEGRVIVSCSALRRGYRDALRQSGNVRFVYLAVERSELERRLEGRDSHFMASSMLDGQFQALEVPSADETDVATIDIRADDAPGSVIKSVEAALEQLRGGTETKPLVSDGAPARSISAGELRGLVGRMVSDEIVDAGARRVLLVPPDHTRLHSRAGEITALLFEQLTAHGCTVKVIPALGTHSRMSREQCLLLFGESVPAESILEHRWRDRLVRLGEISAGEVSALSGGAMTEPIPVEVDEIALGEWDVIVSIGQVVPHEVIGMANFTKNLMIGLGGAATINASHFLGAVCDLETIMGRTFTPVRDLVDSAFDRFLDSRVPVLWALTVMEDTDDGVLQRGFFVGRGGSGDSGGAAFRAAAELAQQCNITTLPNREARISCWLDESEFRTTWLGNKAVYRTRMALADDGELIVLAPGVSRFGEDPQVDALIRRHGYRGRDATLEALRTDPDLRKNLGAAAHLIHGSTEGRFRIIYCTDPERGGLTRAEVESVGYAWRHLSEALDLLNVRATNISGLRVDTEREPFRHISNPALGLWTDGRS